MAAPSRAQDRGRDALDPAHHLGGGAARECQQQDAARIGAVDDQMRDPMGERVGLARAGAGDDQERTGRRNAGCPYSTARRCSGLSRSR